MAPRIAISGSAGVGKSTLARRLSEELGLPLIPEGMREYLEGGGTPLHTIGHDGLRALVLRLWDDRLTAEARASSGFVADRAAHDFAAFWLYYRFAGPDAVTEALFAEALRPDRYDVVFVLPWASIPLSADGVRSTDPYVQLHVHLLIDGLVARHARRVELTDPALDARVLAVRATLGS
jgi:nicotinamide riboside kinase